MSAVKQARLRDFAFARSGDKGSSANIAIFVRRPEDYPWLIEFLTEGEVARYFRPLNVKHVVRYEVPNLEAVNFVLSEVLDGGGSRSLRTDSQGKILGQSLLEMPVVRLPV